MLELGVVGDVASRSWGPPDIELMEWGEVVVGGVGDQGGREGVSCERLGVSGYNFISTIIFNG